MVDGDEPDPGAREIENVDVNEVGRFGSAAIDAFEPVVNGELIEQGVMAFKAELRAEDGAATGSIDDEFAAKGAGCRSRGNEAQFFGCRFDRRGIESLVTSAATILN